MASMLATFCRSSAPAAPSGCGSMDRMMDRQWLWFDAPSMHRSLLSAAAYRAAQRAQHARSSSALPSATGFAAVGARPHR